MKHSFDFLSDIDECANATLNDCHVNATCANNNGSYDCACDTGYTGDGISCSGRFKILCSDDAWYVFNLENLKINRFYDLATLVIDNAS